MRAMRNRLLAVLLLAAVPWIARAEEQGYTNRATELKERAAAEAPTVASLAENTPVKVLARGGAWTKVEAGGKSGWVRVFHLRFPAVVQSSSSGASGLASFGAALGFGQSSNEKARLATTGIRGLSTEDVKNANPDPDALARMQSFRADKPSAERFAREAKLAEAHVDAPKGSGQ